jgi:hypothetical protein
LIPIPPSSNVVLRLRSPAGRKRANCALEAVYVGIRAARITNLVGFVMASPNRNFVAGMRGSFCGCVVDGHCYETALAAMIVLSRR